MCGTQSTAISAVKKTSSAKSQVQERILNYIIILNTNDEPHSPMSLQMTFDVSASLPLADLSVVEQAMQVKRAHNTQHTHTLYVIIYDMGGGP